MKTVPTIGVFTGCLFLLSTAFVRADDWPQWRGPNRDGKVSGFTVPATWPKSLTQKWKTVVGLGDTTPALVGDKLYALARVDDDEVIYCLEAATGKPVWQDKYPADFVVTGPAARHPGPRSSPALADGKVVTVGIGGIVSCLDATSGKVLWREQSDKDFTGVAYKFDAACSPLIVDGMLIVQTGGKGKGAVLAFDLTTGQPKWKCEGEAPAFSSPALMTVAGTRQIVTFTEKLLIGVGLADGKLLWQYPYQADGGNNTTPVVDSQTLYFTGQKKGLTAIQIEKQGDVFITKPLWDNTAGGARFTTPVLKNGLLFGYSDRQSFCCWSAKDGTVQWTDTTTRGMSAAILDAGPVLIGLTVNGELAAFQPSDKAYTELARLKVSETETWAHPILDGNRVFIRDKDSVTLWSFE